MHIYLWWTSVTQIDTESKNMSAILESKLLFRGLISTLLDIGKARCTVWKCAGNPTRLKENLRPWLMTGLFFMSDLSEKKSDLRVCDAGTCRFGGTCRENGADIKCVCQFHVSLTQIGLGSSIRSFFCLKIHQHKVSVMILTTKELNSGIQKAFRVGLPCGFVRIMRLELLAATSCIQEFNQEEDEASLTMKLNHTPVWGVFNSLMYLM